MRDYHLSRRSRSFDAPQRRWLPLLVPAAVVLIASWWFLSPDEEPAPETEVTEAPEAIEAESLPSSISTPLALPGQTGPTPSSSPPREQKSAPSLLPPQSATQVEQPESQVAEQPPAAEVDSLLPESQLTETAPVAVAQAKSAALNWTRHKIRNGDSLASIFKQHKLSPSLLHRIVNSGKKARQLAKIKPGQELRFLLDEQGELQELVLQQSRIDSLHITSKADSFHSQLRSKTVDKRTATVTGTIESSLFVDGQNAGLSDAQIMELAALFAWDIDFALEIRSGDQFRVIYQEEFLEGEKFRNGPILAAEFVNRGTTYQAFRFEDGDEVGYFDAAGRSKRRAFIRTPIKFARVSSRFTKKRWHPVLKKWRSHKGVDYAAPTGTPIKVTGGGRVIFRGWKGGYGRVVIVKHGTKYQTLYAHLSKFASKAKSGSKVKQGQVIGYVGKTGLASGPHLHYEFRVNGVHRNPLTVQLPKSAPLPKTKLAHFEKATAPLIAQLEALARRTMVASSR